MNELTSHISWARVAYQPVIAEAAFARLLVTTQGAQAGLTGTEQVQCATYLAMARDVCATFEPLLGGPSARIAVYDQDGKPLSFQEVNASKAPALAQQLNDQHVRGLFVVGDASFSKYACSTTTFADGSKVAKWGKKLALACDQVCIEISKAPQSADVPTLATDAVLPLGALAVIVTGAALAVIGAVAAWRALDPDFRTNSLLVKQAAVDYATRLGVFKATGTMPAPSVTEQAAVPAVETMAKQRSGTDWLWGAGIAGGLIVGTVASVAIAGRK